MPEVLLRGICCFVARFIDIVLNSRMRVGYSNLSHCFPELSESQIRKIGLESARRMVEMALFVLASPHISLEKLRRRIKVDGYVLSELSKTLENPSPVILVIPHFCMMESITLLPALVDEKLPEVGVFYRPFDNAAIEDWVLKSRQRCKIHLLSRKKSTRVAVDFLRNNGCVAMLFDQNAGLSGSLGLFFDRLAYTTELPRILAQHEKARVACIYAKRTGFWRAQICGNWLEYSSYDDMSAAMNMWLENLLKTDSGLRCDWLWLHRRWARGYYFGMPKFRAGELEKCLEASGGSFKRVCRILITLPASLRETFAAIPMIKQLRNSRPDAKVTAVCQDKFFGVLSAFDFADELLSAPNVDSPLKRIGFFASLRPRYFDLHAVLENSMWADIESVAAGSSERVAIQFPSRRRHFIKKVYKADFASDAESLASVYEGFFRKFGLTGELDFSPIGPRRERPSKTRIAILCGGSGEHAMSPQKWGELIKLLDRSLDEAVFEVYGDEPDARAAYAITAQAEYAEIKNYAAKLGDAEIIRRIGACTVAIGTDCRLTHIANALGVPVVAVYGPTNPIRNGLVYEAPRAVVRPRNSPPQGGVLVELVDVGDVASEALKFIKE